jgi:hypothetical protein
VVHVELFTHCDARFMIRPALTAGGVAMRAERIARRRWPRRGMSREDWPHALRRERLDRPQSRRRSIDGPASLSRASSVTQHCVVLPLDTFHASFTVTCLAEAGGPVPAIERDPREERHRGSHGYEYPGETGGRSCLAESGCSCCCRERPGSRRVNQKENRAMTAIAPIACLSPSSWAAP